MSVSLPDLIRAIRGMIPTEKCNLLEDLVQKLQRREVRLNRQEFLHQVRDIAGDDAPQLRQALKQLALERRSGDGGSGGGGGLDFGLPLPGGDSQSSSSSGGGPNGLSAGDLGSLSSGSGVGGEGGTPAEGGSSSGAGGDGTGGGGASTDAGSAAANGAVKSEDGAVKSEDANGAVKSEDAASGGAPSAAAASGGSGGAPAASAPAAASGGIGTIPGNPLAGAPSSSSATGAAPAAAQQQRLEVAAAAVLVHAAGCKNPSCTVPHCNKMKKIHTHFLECNSQPDCAICKKLKPLTFIHAKHCVAAPGEHCVIPYCARAKRELQMLVHRRGQQQQQAAAAGGGAPGGLPNGMGSGTGAAAGLLQAGALLPGLAGGGGSMTMGGMMGSHGTQRVHAPSHTHTACHGTSLSAQHSAMPSHTLADTPLVLLCVLCAIQVWAAPLSRIWEHKPRPTTSSSSPM